MRRLLFLAILFFSFLQGFPSNTPDIAILDSQLTRKFMPNPTFYSWEMDGAFQTLKELGVSYRVLRDEDLNSKTLASFKILILSGTKNISPEHARAISEYVSRGGKLFALGFASYRDDQDQSTTLHNNFQLSDLLGADYLRYSPLPPHSGALQLQGVLEGRKVVLGRNMSIQIHPHAGTEVLATWLDDDGVTPSAPRSLDAAILENGAKNTIYVGENLFAPENSNSPAVRSLIGDLLNRLASGSVQVSEHQFKGYPILPEFGLLASIAGTKPEIGVGLPFTPLNGYITSEGAFGVYGSSRRRLVVAARKNWTIAFHSVSKGFRVAGKTGSEFVFIPRDRNLPLKIVMWHGGESPMSPFKFASFRGELILKELAGKKVLINRLPMEAYLPGVVSHEVPFYFHPQSLRAMAVVARTFALREIKAKKFKGYDICATVSCQAYEGLFYESPAARDAVSESAGKVLTYHHDFADLPYHATCGGITEDIEEAWNLSPVPYLRSVVDGEAPITENLKTDAGVEQFLLHPPESFCKFSSRFRWKEAYTRGELEGLFKTSLPVLLKRPVDFDRIIDLQVGGRTGHGHATTLEITTNREKINVGKDQIRWLFSGGEVGLGGLQSTLFVIEKKKDSEGNLDAITFLGGGWGHGVGMCQFGAEGMARRGYTWQQILSHYFPGTTVIQSGKTSQR